MRPFERRVSGAYPYFKVATWDARNVVWKAGKATFASEADAARSVAGRPGRYRVTRVEEAGKVELEAFAV